jgi:hypothetical protein
LTPCNVADKITAFSAFPPTKGEKMSRFIGLLTFLTTVTAVTAAWAGRQPVHHVPELGTAGAAAGVALIAGALAIALGRRRGRKSS